MFSSLRSRLAIGLASVLLLLALTSLAVVAVTDRVRAGYDHTVKTDDALMYNVVQRTKLMDDEETGVRGYLLTRDWSFLTPYLNARRQLPNFRHQTFALLQREPSASPLNATMTDHAQAWELWAAAVLKNPSAALDPVTIDARMSTGKRLFNRFRTTSSKLVHFLSVREQRNLSTDHTFLNRIVLFSLLALVLGCLALLALGLWITSSIADPLRRLQRAAATIGQGNLGQQIEPAHIREFAVLTTALEQMRRQLAGHRQLMATVSSTLDLEEVYASFAELLRDLVPFDRLSVNLPSSDGELMVREFATGIGIEALPMGYSGPAGGAVASLVSQTGEPLLRADLIACSDGDLFEDERLLRNTGIRSTAILPLTVQGRTIGTVNLASSRVGAFTPAEVSAVRALAPVVAAAIENARLYRSLRVAQQEVGEAHREEFDRARQDPLTGLPNRRRLSEDLTTMRARARRYGAAHGCSIAMIDVDYFKQYNDRYGHLAGDQVLMRVADALQSELRSGDVVYRYGGEEFVALLIEADPAAATAVAHRLRQCVERLGIVHEARPAPAIVTCSIGVAALCIAEDEDAGMLADADAMLYRAKSAGRNRVVS